MTGIRSIAARVIAFLLVYVLSGLPIFAGGLVGWPRWETIPGTILWALLIPVFWLGTRLLARWVGIDQLGLQRQPGWGRQLGLGAGLGIGLVGMVLLLGLLTGSFRLTGFLVGGLGPLRLLIIGLEYLYVAVSEEVVFRSFLSELLPRGLARPWVALIATLLFTGAHLRKTGLDPLLLSFIFLLGLVLMLAYLRTGALWVSIGLHWAYDGFNLLLLEQDQVLVKEWGPGAHLWLYIVGTLALLLVVALRLRPHAKRRHSGTLAA